MRPAQSCQYCSSQNHSSSTPIHDLPQRILCIATLSSIGGTLILACLGEHQLARMAGFLIYTPGNIIWILFSRRIRSRQLLLLNSVFLVMSCWGVINNL